MSIVFAALNLLILVTCSFFPTSLIPEHFIYFNSLIFDQEDYVEEVADFLGTALSVVSVKFSYNSSLHICNCLS